MYWLQHTEFSQKAFDKSNGNFKWVWKTKKIYEEEPTDLPRKLPKNFRLFRQRKGKKGFERIL